MIIRLRCIESTPKVNLSLHQVHVLYMLVLFFLGFQFKNISCLRFIFISYGRIYSGIHNGRKLREDATEIFFICFVQLVLQRKKRLHCPVRLRASLGGTRERFTS